MHPLNIIPAGVGVGCLVVAGRVGRVAVEEPEEERCDDDGAADGEPDLGLEHVQELEERLLANFLPQYDGDARLNGIIVDVQQFCGLRCLNFSSGSYGRRYSPYEF